MATPQQQTLQDLGEDRIVADLVARYLGAPDTGPVELGIGDDAAIFHIPTDRRELVTTIDPCPTPVLELLGFATMTDWGRLAGAISISDLAAMGAAPLGLLSSTTMPASMPSTRYEEYCAGLDEICRKHGVPIVGGNIRDGAEFSATTVALGTCRPGTAFRRDRATLGDCIVVIGPSGLFWSAVAQILWENCNLDDLSIAQRRSLTRPRPLIQESLAIQSLGITSTAIDCSDGLGGALTSIAAASAIAIHIDFNNFSVDPAVEGVATRLGLELESLLLAWGDWQLVIAISPAEYSRLKNELAPFGCPVDLIGTCEMGDGLLAKPFGADLYSPVKRSFASKRFEHLSYLTHGLNGYAETLKKSPFSLTDR